MLQLQGVRADREGVVRSLPQMRKRLDSASADALDRLCRSAEERTAALGHSLDAWSGDGVGRRAACAKCGRAVYVRAEGQLAGMAGRAVGERCD